MVAEATALMGALLRDVMQLNWDRRNFRIFGPDETTSNRLSRLFDITERTSTAEILKSDDHISADGRSDTHTAGRSGWPNSLQRHA